MHWLLTRAVNHHSNTTTMVVPFADSVAWKWQISPPHPWVQQAGSTWRLQELSWRAHGRRRMSDCGNDCGKYRRRHPLSSVLCRWQYFQLQRRSLIVRPRLSLPRSCCQSSSVIIARQCASQSRRQWRRGRWQPLLPGSRDGNVGAPSGDVNDDYDDKLRWRLQAGLRWRQWHQQGWGGGGRNDGGTTRRPIRNI